MRQYQHDRDPRERDLRVQETDAGALRRRSRAVLHDDAAGRHGDALPAVQPWLRRTAPATRPTAQGELSHGLSLGGGACSATACSISSRGSSTCRSRKGAPTKGRRCKKETMIFPATTSWRRCASSWQPRAREGAGQQLPGPALGGQRQEQHHRLARAPARHPAQRARTSGCSTA